MCRMMSAVTSTWSVQAALEDLHLIEVYGLVFAAAALHWTAPLDRWSRIAALLEPEGVFASFAGQIVTS